MKWKIFSHANVPGAATGTRAVNSWEFDGDDEGLVADEIVEELEDNGHTVIRVEAKTDPDRLPWYRR